MTELAHAILSASGSGRWLACTGSRRMEANEPDLDNIFSAEGTAAHHFGERALRERRDLKAYIGESILIPMQEMVAGEIQHRKARFEVDEEMAYHLQQYVDYVRAIPGHLIVEKRLDYSRWVPEGFGTGDAIVLNQPRCTITDLKYGTRLRVDAPHNSQGQHYGMGVYNHYANFWDIKEFLLVIHQPRLEHVSEWLISTEDLLKFAGVSRERAIEAMTDNAPITPGVSQCTWCKASGKCRPQMEYIFKKIGIDHLL